MKNTPKQWISALICLATLLPLALPGRAEALDTTAPTNGTLSASASSGQVSLSWSGFSDSGSGIANYTLVYSMSGSPTSCSGGTQIYSSTGTSYTHTDLTNGTTYYYRICATDVDGNTSSGITTNATPVNSLATGVSGGYFNNLVVDSANAYWTEYNGETVKKVAINGGTVTTLASGLNSPMGLAVDSTNVYWTEFEGGTIKKVGINGGTVTTLASGLSYPIYIAVDSTNVYWIEYGSGTVKKENINGGPIITLASGLSSL